MPADPLDPLVEIIPADRDATSEQGANQALPSREDRCWLLSPKHGQRLEAEIARKLAPAFAEILQQDADTAERRVTEAVAAFFPIYAQRPVRNNKGGGLINDSLCLYVAARLLAPRFIVESGSYQGHSAWLLRQACPHAEIISFDIRLSQLLHREADVTYCEGDWMERELPSFDPGTALAWFDDHINQARRLREAQARGFRQALFDDNFPVFNLYATGGVPRPTLAMVMDDSLTDGEEIRWMRHGKIFTYRYEKKHVFEARAVIKRYLPLPDLTSVTRYSPPSGMTYVELGR